jgi:hypothetical protein
MAEALNLKFLPLKSKDHEKQRDMEGNPSAGCEHHHRSHHSTGHHQLHGPRPDWDVIPNKTKKSQDDNNALGFLLCFYCFISAQRIHPRRL